MNIPEELHELPGSAILSTVDSTKLKCFLTCPRKYLYEYILHYRKSAPNIHLEFGTAWHLAKEYLLNHGTTKENIPQAYALFLEHFRKFFPASEDLNVAPKNPGNALVALNEYVEQFASTNTHLSIVATEIAGRVAIGPHLLSVKIDAVVEDRDGCRWDLDHKTSSRDSNTDDAAWTLSVQINAYIHALHCMSLDKEVKGALIDVAVLRKTGNLHKRLFIYRRMEALDEWYTSTLRWLDALEAEYQLLALTMHEEGNLPAFPQNTESCTKYGLCPYYQLCCSPHNPMLRKDPPPGFKREIWNPHFSDKAWRPKHILEPDGTVHSPSPEDLKSYEAAAEAASEAMRLTDEGTLKGLRFI